MALAKDVGRLLRALRKHRGLTQAALAELIGRSEVAVRSIERGASAPSFKTLERLAQALEVPAARFFPTADVPAMTEGHARELAVLETLLRDLSAEDLTVALALLHTLTRIRNLR